MSDFKSIPHFRFWCQKVLPLTYDNSLSYMELLNKVVYYLNHVIDDINKIPDIINSLITDEKLKEIMGELFDELREQIANANEGMNTNASHDREKGELVWLNGKLVIMTRDILAGDRYVEETGEVGVTGNYKYTTIEEIIGNIDELTTTTKSSIVLAINELNTLIENLNGMVGDLSELDTEDKENIVSAMNELYDIIQNVDNKFADYLVKTNPLFVGNLHNVTNLDMGSSRVFQGQADGANISNPTLNNPSKTTSTPVIKSELFTAFNEEEYNGKFVTDAHFVTVKQPNSKCKSASVVAEIFDYNPRHLDTIAVLGSAKAAADWDGVTENWLGGLWGGWFIASNEGHDVPIIGAELNLLNTYKDELDAVDPYTSDPADISYVCQIFPDWSTHTIARGLSIEGAYNYGKHIGYGTGISVRDYCQRGIFIDTTLEYADPQTEEQRVYPVGIMFGAHSFRKMAVYDHIDDKIKFEQRLEGGNRYWSFRKDENNVWLSLDDYDNSILFVERVRMKKSSTNYTVLLEENNEHKYLAFDSNIHGLLLTDNNIRLYPYEDNVVLANVDSSKNYVTINTTSNDIIFGDSKNKVKPNGHVSIGSTDDIGNSGNVAGLSINADSVLPFCMKKTSSGSGTQPGANVGCLRFETGTTSGTLKLVAYAGTSNVGVTIVDNIGSGNS